MDTSKIVQAALEGLAAVVRIIAALKAQGAMTDDQLREYAKTLDAETRTNVEKFLAEVQAQ